MEDGHEPTKLFVGQIPKDMNEDVLKHYFDEFGPISEVSIIRDNNTMMSRGCAFVTFLYAQSAQMAINSLHDKVKLPNSHNLLQVRLAETHVERENKLFIGMLPKTVTEQDLYNMFHFYGELREVHIIRGPDGSPKGCAFVKFVDREAAIAAIEDLHDTIPMGATRPLVVKFADGKKNQGKIYDYWNGPNALGGANYNRAQQQQQPPPQAGLHIQPQARQMYNQYPLPMGQLPHQQMTGMSFISSGGTMPLPSLVGPQQPPQMSMQQLPHQQLPHQQVSHQHQPPQVQRPLYSTTAPEEFFPPSQPPASYAPISPSAMPYLPVNPPRDMVQRGSMVFQSNSGSTMHASERSNPMGGGGSMPPSAAPGLQQSSSYGRDQPSKFSSYPQYGQEAMHARPPEGPSGANLFIYHLPRDLTDADLATLFAPFGNVISAKVFVDRKTADSKGFGFVSYDTLESANAAIDSMNGFQIGSKRLKVQHKRVSNATYAQHAHSSPSFPQGDNYMYSSISNGAQNYQYEESQPNRSSSISEDVVAAFDMMNLSGAPAASSNVVAQGHSSHSGPPFSASSSVGHTPRHDSDTVLNAPSLYENEEYANAPSFPYSGRGMPSGAPPPLPLGSEHNGVDSVTRDNSSSLDRGPGFALDAHSADFGEYDLLSASNHTGKGNN